jgi:tRNA G18 (ribose-2'-O)-methylase SpoU
VLVPVTSLEAPELDDYRDVRDKDRLARGVVTVEGDVTLRVLVRRGRLAVRSLFLSESRLTALSDVVSALRDDVPVYVAPAAVMDAIVGFPIHRGALAACERPAAVAPSALLSTLDDGLVVALEEVNNHDNVGGIFRNAAAFGARAVLLDERSCDPLYRKAIRVSAGAALFVPFAHGGTRGDLVSALKGAGYTVIALTPSATIDVRDVPRPPRVALLLGAEGPGLSAESMAAADVCARIAMVPGFDSLNVAVASGIAMHALFRP